MTGWLVNAAEASNLLSLMTVVLCFLLMVFLLLRLTGQDFGEGKAVTAVRHTPPRVNYTRHLLPLSLSFTGSSQTDRLDMKLSALTEGKFRVFWGVDIAAFHQVLRAPQGWFLSALFEGNLFGEGKCQQLGQVQEFSSCDDSNLTLSRDTSLQLNLGPAPREVFPVVVVLAAPSGESLITAIHIRDTVCPVPSQILAQYYRYGDTVNLLQPLYIAASDIPESSDTESQEDSETEDMQDKQGRRGGARCIICQQERICRVVLPCRHATTCGGCFARLDSRCPMCRGFIQSYFLLRPEPPSPPTRPNQDGASLDQTTTSLVRSLLESARLWFVDAAGP